MTAMEEVVDNGKDMIEREAGTEAEERSVRLLSASTLKDLGFTEKWPSGNPKEPWWENPFEMSLWLTRRPTVSDFWGQIREIFREEGRKEVRNLLNRALGR